MITSSLTSVGFPSESRQCNGGVDGGEDEEGKAGGEGVGECATAPGHGVEALDGPAGGEDDAKLLDDFGHHEGGEPGAAEHDDDEHAQDGEATALLLGLPDCGDEQAESGGHEGGHEGDQEEAGNAAVDTNAVDEDAEEHDGGDD